LRSRPNNEDSLLVGAGADRNLFAVADDMGGHRAGEVASFIATALLGRLGSEDTLEGVIRRANRSIVAAQGDEDLAGMGTTVVALRLSETQEGPVGEIAHVGDSRAYLLRDGRLRRLTEQTSPRKRYTFLYPPRSTKPLPRPGNRLQYRQS
jgi:protein phosphatase